MLLSINRPLPLTLIRHLYVLLFISSSCSFHITDLHTLESLVRISSKRQTSFSSYSILHTISPSLHTLSLTLQLPLALFNGLSHSLPYEGSQPSSFTQELNHTQAPEVTALGATTAGEASLFTRFASVWPAIALRLDSCRVL